MKNLIVFFLFLTLIKGVNIYAQPTESSILFNKAGSYLTIPSSPSLSPSKEITVECWIKPNTANWNNKPQTILSKKQYNSLSTFVDKQNWEMYDATNANGKNNVMGFVGAVFDGRYIYFSPWWRGGDEPQSGEVLRYDTYGSYQDVTSWTIYDAENEDGNNGIKGLEGAVFDGRYVYFVPLHANSAYKSQVLRYDTTKDFSDSSSWDIYDMANEEYPDAQGFVGAVFDGQYIYFMPNPYVAHLKLPRYNTYSSFSDPSSWEICDLTLQFNVDEISGFFGGVYDGQYIYFVPDNSNGNILRFNTLKPFSDSTAWEKYNIIDLLPPHYDTDFAGATFDGRYIYFSPQSNGNVVRFDTKGAFSDKGSWQSMYILDLNGDNSIYGGIGPVFDGRYIYFPPMFNSTEGRSGKFVIYDTYSEFTNLNSWNFFDWKTQDEQLAGFEGAVFDGQHVYFSPMNFEDPHGKILRYNSTNGNGLSYSLVYNQSSSSFGSVMQRLSFQIGTTGGLRAIFLGEETNLADGEWHLIAGTYDGTVLKIYLDGQLNNQITYTTPADLLVNEADITIGAESEHSNTFDGLIDNISIRNRAVTDDEILQHATCKAFGEIDSSLLACWLFEEGQGNRVNDLSWNNNTGYLVNEPKWVKSEIPLKIFAGADQEVCSNDLPFMLKDFYPAGGVWAGNGVSASGLFTPAESLANTTQKLVYTYTDESGCTYSSLKLIFVRYSTYQPQITEAYDSFLCPGEFTTLTIDRDYNQYVWSTGDTTKSIQVSQPGTYSVKVAAGDSCLSLFSEPVTIQVFPELPTPVISLTDLTSLKAEISGNNLHFEWKRNNDTLPFHTQTIKVTQTGFYSVRIINSNNCYSEFSESFYFTPPKSDDILDKNITIAPNPSEGIFQITVSDFTEDIVISVTNSSGKTVYQSTLAVNEGITIKEINLTHLPKSLYMMSFVTHYGVSHKKIIIQ